MVRFPTSNDIYLEINGKKLAVAQSYRAQSVRESRYVEAFGSPEPVATVAGRVQHRLELARVCISDAQDEVEFRELADFNVVIVKPDRKIIYSGCQWADIQESATLGNLVLESVRIVATKKMELR